jgi:hypothetical protein
MTVSRQEIVAVLNRAGLADAAAAALATLPEQVDDKDAEKFCEQHGLSPGKVMDLMGGSP